MMGYYIETDSRHGKAQFIVDNYGGEMVTEHQARQTFTEHPRTRAAIVVVDNGEFEAAAFAYDVREFADFTRPDDRRPKRFATMPLARAIELTGFKTA